MTPEEAQQAQIIEQIDYAVNSCLMQKCDYERAIESLREIVDSQAQKIAELKKSIASLYAHIDEMEAVK